MLGKFALAAPAGPAVPTAPVGATDLKFPEEILKHTKTFPDAQKKEFTDSVRKFKEIAKGCIGRPGSSALKKLGKTRRHGPVPAGRLRVGGRRGCAGRGTSTPAEGLDRPAS